MNDKLLQKAANITVTLNYIYSAQNRADIPRSKLRELEPAKKALEDELWNVIVSKLSSSETTLKSAVDTKLISDKIAEAKTKLAEEKKSKKATK